MYQGGSEILQCHYRCFSKKNPVLNQTQIRGNEMIDKNTNVLQKSQYHIHFVTFEKTFIISALIVYGNNLIFEIILI